MEIKLKDIKIIPDLNSVRREKIDDEIYFSKKYSHYISNSRLKLINPDQKGSPSIYKKGFTGEMTQALALGSSIHLLALQKDEFYLAPDIEKPSAKLGLVIDAISKYRKRGKSINDSIIKACKDVHYYENSIDLKRIKAIISSGLKYYYNLKNIVDNAAIVLSSKDRSVCETCVNNLRNDRQVERLLNPKDMFGDPILSFNEDAFFMEFDAEHEEKKTRIAIKMKADNWSIDVENKIITLNDLKTTGHLLCQFMEGSFINFHYSRQFAMYLYVLLRYCEKEYGYNPEEWTFKCNVIVVETTADNRVGVFNISTTDLENGRREFCKLLKMVAYCEMTDYSDDIVFV